MAVSRTSKGSVGAAERKRLEIEWRKHLVSVRLLEGKRKVDIATELGVSPSLITALCKELDKQYLAHYLRNILEHKAKELARIDRREAFCWEQLYRSMEIRRQDQQFTDCRSWRSRLAPYPTSVVR